MSEKYDIEKREFLRTPIAFEVEYRFLDAAEPDRYPEFYRGNTHNISGGGMLLSGAIPHSSWVPDLLMGKILVGVKVSLNDGVVVKAIAKMAWVEKLKDSSCFIGLKFQEITQKTRDSLVQAVLEHHLP